MSVTISNKKNHDDEIRRMIVVVAVKGKDQTNFLEKFMC
jgi:hypothetical protein